MFSKVGNILSSKKVAVGSSDEMKYGMNTVGVSLNSVSVGLMSLILRKKSSAAHNDEQLCKSKIVSFKHAQELLMRESSLEEQAKSQALNSRTKKPSMYVYKNSDGELKRRGSKDESINRVGQILRACAFFRMGFNSQEFKNVVEKVNEYRNISAGADLTDRKSQLKELEKCVATWNESHAGEKGKSSLMKGHVAELSEYVKSELAILGKLENGGRKNVANDIAQGAAILARH